MKNQKALLRSFNRLCLLPAQKKACLTIAGECALTSYYIPLNQLDPVTDSNPPQNLLDAGVTYEMLRALSHQILSKIIKDSI